MKRGKEYEKIRGPMFPRLHVNDQEKGGPRAPPRNKMALYEQLTLPSQRFNTPPLLPLAAVLPPPPPASSTSNHQRNRASFTQVVEQRKESSDEDDFTVPIFVLAAGDNHHHHHSNIVGEKVSPTSQPYSSYSKIQTAVPKHSNGGIKQNLENDNTVKAVSFSQSMDQSEQEGSPTEDPWNDFKRLQRGDRSILPEQGADLQSDPIRGRGRMFSSRAIDVNRENSTVSPRKFPALRNRDEEQTHRSLQASIGRRGDEVSETSMVESVSEMDISPDDVVGLIGQKHFWKARKAFVNQQRVFAVQVFELHRLIKVQRLIAESPHLLLEDDGYMETPIKPSSAKKLTLEYIAKPPLNISKQKNESEKPNDKIECSAENTVGKASISSVQNGSQPLNHKEFVGNPQPTPLTSGPNMSPWGFHPQGHQWLVPVMTATEGLVYKPYSGPAFANPPYGSHGPPPGSTPAMGNFMSPQHYQGAGPPFFPPGPHGYFPQYGMTGMNPNIPGQVAEQTSHYITQDSLGELSGGGANFSVQRQNSCDQPTQRTQKDGAFSHAQKSITPKDRELHASTASSPVERARGSRLSNTMERNNVLPLFPTTPATTDIPNGSASHVVDERPSQTIRDMPRNGNSSHVEVERPSRVIKVVPHNGRSASEFAARIFRSIQEERNQNDSV